ncbi:MarR family transcriptional regulator [Cognatishimia sp. SS12]|uniref:MarR family winged helix-turn-helix transcriptional regulator n=1 Tax=Cognatishimia sp. SS12 TaxID=2979465 RepID=UPI00233148F2|nr:MarR family transcriptional regulator [Cognatishimia sp. SS12]MDC0739274.1 MarR family transcriptional regulator [Cognatishimia sp. SS12]
MTLTADQIHHIHRMAHREWTMAARPLGLSFSEFEYLSAVYAEEERMRIEDEHGQHLQDIVSALGVSKASASTMIAKLETRGLVRRFQCQMDDRAKHIVLTDEGRDLMAKGQAVYTRVAKALAADTR